MVEIDWQSLPQPKDAGPWPRITAKGLIRCTMCLPGLVRFLLKEMGEKDRDWLRALTWAQRWTIWRGTQRIRWAFASGYLKAAMIDHARNDGTR